MSSSQLGSVSGVLQATTSVHSLTRPSHDRRNSSDLLAAGKSEKGIKPPQWSYAEDGSAAFDRQRVCTIEFDVPYDLRKSRRVLYCSRRIVVLTMATPSLIAPSVFLYYKLTN